MASTASFGDINSNKLNQSSDSLKKKSNGHNNNNTQSKNSEVVAIEFKNLISSLLQAKPPISKDKMDQITKEAIRSTRNYKHIVYYVETFIKNCPPQYKVPGLYIIDAIIRNNTKNEKASIKKSKDTYMKRFSKNMCKTFTNLYNKCPANEREKITRVLQLWQKYNVIESDLIEKLNRISEAAKLDMAINNGNLNTSNASSLTDLDKTGMSIDDSDTKKLNNPKLNSNKRSSETDRLKKLKYFQDKLSKHQKIMNSTTASEADRSNSSKICDQLISDLHKLTEKILNNSVSSKNKKKDTNEKSVNDKNIHNTSGNNNINASPITKNEISQLLGHDSDSDSDTSPNRNLKRKSNNNNNNSDLAGPGSENTSFNTSNTSDKLNNCAAWLKSVNSTEEESSKRIKTINLPDLSQPPPPLLANFQSLATAPPPPPPLPPLPPPPPSSTVDKEKQRQIEKEKMKERSKRGLPNLRDKHICICSKTLWLGHLSKLTTEDIVIEELIELLSHDSDRRSKSSSSKKLTKEKVIAEVNLIPPRGCAYVEFVDRKLASKCLDRMKDGYRLDGNSIKVAWATNKGINKDKRIKQHWNVEVGCTYVPWSDLNGLNSIDFSKWAEGGLVDEESVPSSHIDLYRKQISASSNINSNNSGSVSINTETSNLKQDENDMELDTDEDHNNSSLNQQTASIQPTNQQTQFQLIHPNQLLNLPPNIMNSQYQTLSFLQQSAPPPNSINFLNAPPPPSSGTFSQHQSNGPPQPVPMPVPPPQPINHSHQIQLINPHQYQQFHQQQHHHQPSLHSHFHQHLDNNTSSTNNPNQEPNNIDDKSQHNEHMIIDPNSQDLNSQLQSTQNLLNQQHSIMNTLNGGPQAGAHPPQTVIQLQQPFADLINNRFNNQQQQQQQHFQLVQRPLISIRGPVPPPPGALPLAAVNPGLFRHINIIGQPLSAAQLASNEQQQSQTQQQIDLNEAANSSNAHLINLMNQVNKSATGQPNPAIRNLNPLIQTFHHLNPNQIINLTNHLQINGSNQHPNDILFSNGNLNQQQQQQQQQPIEELNHQMDSLYQTQQNNEETLNHQNSASTNIKSLMEMKFQPPNEQLNNIKEKTDDKDNNESSTSESRNYNNNSQKSKYNNSSWRHSTSPSRKSSDKYSYSNHHTSSSNYSNDRNNWNHGGSKRHSYSSSNNKYNNRHYNNNSYSKNDESTTERK